MSLKNIGYIFMGAVFVLALSLGNLILVRRVLYDWQGQLGDGVTPTLDETGALCRERFLLLTTQRSGSTWTCGLLDDQNGVSCGSHRLEHFENRRNELLIKYSMVDKSNVTWQKYENDLDKAFSDVCKHNPGPSIGFKLMYDQVPPQFLENGNLETYLRKNNVYIVHLVREAKILVLSSKSNVGKRGFHHTSNSTLAKEVQDKGTKLQWERHITHMLKLEEESTRWQDRVHQMAPAVHYYYVSYESLLVRDERDFWVGQLVGFLTRAGHGSSIQGATGGLVQLSEPSCADRIVNYEGFKNHELAGSSRSAAACNYLERILSRNAHHQ